MNRYWIAVIFSMLCLTGCEKGCISNPQNTSTKGCGFLFVYDDHEIPSNPNSYIWVQADDENLNLGSEFKTFDLSLNPHIASAIESWNSPYQYCTDALIWGQERTHEWTARSGLAKIRIERDYNSCERGYVVDVELVNVTYEDSTGNQLTVQNKYFDNILVGFRIP